MIHMIGDKERLSERLSEVEQKIEDSFFLQEVDVIRERLDKQVFKIVIVGHFSAGKSTFLNALLKDKILPSSANETTAAATRVFSVDDTSTFANKAKILFRNGHEEIISIQENKEALKKYVSLLQNEIDVASEIEYVDLYLVNQSQPKTICFVDTPGDNGLAKEIFETTKKEIKDAAAIIYLMPNRGFADSDRELLDYISQYQDRLFFVLNQIDLIPEDERREMIEHVRSQAEQLTGVREPEIFGLSSLLALNGKKANNKQMLKKWGFTHFENTLTSYLNDSAFVQDYYKSIENQIKILNGEVEEALKAEKDVYNKNKNKLHRRAQFARKKYIEMEQSLLGFVDEETEKIQQLVDETSKSWIDPSVQTCSVFLNEKAKKLNREIKKSSAEDLVEVIYQKFSTFDEEIQAKVKVIIQGFQTKTKGFLESVTGNVAKRNQEIIQLILQYESEENGEFKYLQSLKTSLSKKSFSFQSIPVSYFSHVVGDMRTVMTEKQELEKTIPKLKADKEKLADDLKQNQLSQDREFEGYKREKKAIGPMPDIETYRETSKESRGGLLGFFGFKKTVTHTYTDDSKQQNWKKKQSKIEKEFDRKRASLEKKNKELLALRTSLTKKERDASRLLTDLEIEQQQLVNQLLDSVLNTYKKYARQLESDLRKYFHEYVSKIQRACYEDIMKDRDDIVEVIRRAVRLQMEETENEIYKSIGGKKHA